MPTYEYECANCKKVFEVFQKITDKPLEKCPKCHKHIKRLISAGAGFIFKGPGFYATDYRKNPSAGAKAPACAKENKEGCKGCPHAGKD
jgi:putative FmdB family regulatory protein